MVLYNTLVQQYATNHWVTKYGEDRSKIDYNSDKQFNIQKKQFKESFQNNNNNNNNKN